MPRLFFAIESPDLLKKELVTLQDTLAAKFRNTIPIPNFKPEHLTNSHCTIRFLGNIEESKVEVIANAAWEVIACAQLRPFECQLTECGVFPNRRNARVMWIGLSPEEPFQHIQRTVDKGLTAAGISFEQEHRFHPHLTLFRFREPYRLPSNFDFPDLTASHFVTIISEIALIESKTFSDGPQYTIRAKFALK